MYQEEYKRWLAADLQDADLNPELSKIEGNDEEIKDRFAVALKFGTAGLRGVLGAGTNRMNIYTVRKAIIFPLVPELNPTLLTTPVVVVVAFFDTKPRHYAHQLVLIEFRGTIYLF